VVLGQTVLVDGLTVIEDRAQSSSVALSALAVGQFVEVSGLIDANGTISRDADRASNGFFVASVTEVDVRKHAQRPGYECTHLRAWGADGEFSYGHSGGLH